MDHHATTTTEGEAPPRPSLLLPIVAFAGLAVIATLFVASTLLRPEPRGYEPTPPSPVASGDTLVGPVVYTVDAREDLRWRYFDFSRGSVVEDPSELEWDLAFQRLWVIVNGGSGFAGEGGVVDLGPIAFDSVQGAPESGYVSTETRTDTINRAIARWYDYSFLSHLLTPKPHTYIVRTAEGRYAKLELLGYYCRGSVGGCMTFRYTYQGSNSRSFQR